MIDLAYWCRANPYLAAMEIEQHKARIEALEAALREVMLQNVEPYCREIARAALEQDK